MSKRIEKAVADDHNCFYKHQKEEFFKELGGHYEAKQEKHDEKLASIKDSIFLDK
jgi:hypothetical protein